MRLSVGVYAVLRQYNADYQSALMPVGTLHLTVVLLRLETAEEYTKASEVFSKSQNALRVVVNEYVEALAKKQQVTLAQNTETKSAESTDTKHVGAISQPLEMRFRGVTTFKGDKTLFAETDSTHAHNGVLVHLARKLSEIFKGAGLNVTSADKELRDDAFTPHLSILRLGKFSGPRSAGPKRVDKKSFEALKDLDCGRQAVGSLDLLAMGGGKQVSFYVFCVSIPWNSVYSFACVSSRTVIIAYCNVCRCTSHTITC